MEGKLSSPPPVLVPALHPLVRLRTALLPRLLGPVRPALGWPAQAQLCTPISLSVCIYFSVARTLALLSPAAKFQIGPHGTTATEHVEVGSNLGIDRYAGNMT